MGRRGFAFAWLYQALHLPLSLYIYIYLCTHRLDAYKLLQTTHALSSSMAHAGPLQITIGHCIALHTAAGRPALSGFIARLRGTCFTMQVQT
jgi:hypothetical protein